MNFPNNPTVGDIFDYGGVSFVWNGQVWALVSSETAGGGVPRGGIILWSGAADAVPAGWALCDGGNGTPNLRGRFVIGAGGVYNPGDTGGAESVTLTEAQLPSHDHNVNLTSQGAGGHTHQYAQALSYNFVPVSGSVTKGFVNGGGFPNETFRTSDNPGNHTHAISGNTGSKGGGAAHENRPPYFALAYIMRL